VDANTVDHHPATGTGTGGDTTVDPGSGPGGDGDVAWMISRLATETAGVTHVLVATSDGQPMLTSRRLSPEDDEQFAVIVSGLTSLATGATNLLELGPVRHCVVEMARGYLISMAISDGSCLAALAHADADVAVIGHDMARLVARLGPWLTPAKRSELTRTALR